MTSGNSVANATGKIGSSALFTTTANSFLSAPDSVNLSTGCCDFTVSAWVYLSSKTSNMAIISKWSGGQEEYILQYETAVDRFLFYVSPDGSTSVSVRADVLGSPALNTWYYIVAWRDSTSHNIYIQVNNGTPNSVTENGGIDGTAALQVGAYSTSVWNGRIDEVSFWKRMLNATERATLYNAGVGCQYPLTCNVDNYVYDGDGNLVKSTENGVTVVHIGNYYEWNGSAGTKYYYADGQSVAMRNAAGTLYFLLNDHLGSTNVVADTNGNQYGKDMYMPWGPIRYTSGTVPSSYTFTGARREAGIGALYHFGSRWYDQWTDRFLSADSIIPDIGNPQTLNRYSYAYGNPLKYTDPTGHCPFCIVIIAAAAAFIGIDLLHAEDPQHVTPQMVQATQLGTGLFIFGAGAAADFIAGTAFSYTEGCRILMCYSESEK